MRHDRLKRILKASLRAALASSPLLATSCGVFDGPGVDTEGFDPPQCEGNALSLANLQPPVIPDVVQLWSVTTNGPQLPQMGRSLISSHGTPCLTASDESACRSALEALAPEERFGRDCVDLCNDFYLATTRGDVVEAHGTLDALTAFLGTIDAPQEALLLGLAHAYDVSCTDLREGGVRALSGGGYEVIVASGYACGPDTARRQHLLEVSESGEVREKESHILEKGDPGCSIGRRPEGLARAAGASEDEVGRFFGAVAQLEAASVPAFLRLRKELEAHGAPPELVREALGSAADEVRHARATTALARRFGAEVGVPRVGALPVRPLLQLALDNRVEGCVRETYGALVAHHQASHAKDPVVRESMARIAEDETRHATLSWKVDAWAMARLSPEERDILAAAERSAIETLRGEVAESLDPVIVATAGMPTASTATALVDELRARLWDA